MSTSANLMQRLLRVALSVPQRYDRAHPYKMQYASPFDTLANGERVRGWPVRLHSSTSGHCFIGSAK